MTWESGIKMLRLTKTYTIFDWLKFHFLTLQLVLTIVHRKVCRFVGFKLVSRVQCTQQHSKLIILDHLAVY